MKKIILSAIMAVPLLAQSSNFFEIGLGTQKTTDSFHADSTQNNANYNETDSFNNGIPYIQFQYSYKNFITKTFKENILFGYTNDKLTAGLFINMLNGKDTAWTNPYSLNTSKEKTKVSKNGLLVDYSLVKNANYASKITYIYTKHDIDNDTTVSALQRDANDHKIIIDNRYKSNILYNFSYNIHDANGEESSFKKYGLGIGYIHNVDKTLKVVLLANIGKTSYDATNSILNEKIDSTNTKFTVATTWKNPFNMQDKYLKLILQNENEDANHDFYDKEQQLAIVSMGFKF